MLVLSRKTDEQIVIGDGIRITVLRVTGDRVKLGIQAGDDMKIMRAELLATTGNPQQQPSQEPQSRIADPTAGMGEDGSKDEGPSPVAGACEEPSGSGRLPSRPNWLTICCCS